MRTITIVAGMFLLSLYATGMAAAQENNITEDIIDDIEPYEGSIGPGNALYGLKIAFENIDEFFTFNETEKLGKQVAHARQRIAEAKAELRKNNVQAATDALEEYREKIKVSEGLITGITEADSGLLNAQKRIVKHQFVLERLLELHPNNTGLQRAYNNSIELEEKFESKTRQKLERTEAKDRLKIKIRSIEGEKIEIKAKIIDDAAEIKVEAKFLSSNTENFTIAQDILDKVRLSSENIAGIIEVEVEEEEEKELKTELEAEAKIEDGFARVEFEYRFFLDTTNTTEIIEGTMLQLSALRIEDITAVLEIEKKDGKKEEIRAGREVEEEQENETVEGNENKRGRGR